MAKDSLNLPYIIVAGVVIAGLVISFLVLWPQIQEIMRLREETAKAQNELQERRVFLASIDRKLATLRSQTVPEQELSVALPEDSSFEDVLRIIDRNATAAGVAVLSVENRSQSAQAAARAAQARDEESGVPEGVTPHRAEITAVGTYQQIRRFIESLENTIRIMDIVNLHISERDDNDQLSVAVTVQFYAYDDTEL